MTKISLFLATFLMVFAFALPAKAMTEEERQITIQVLTLQIQILQAQIDAILSGATPEYVEPEVQSTGVGYAPEEETVEYEIRGVVGTAYDEPDTFLGISVQVLDYWQNDVVSVSVKNKETGEVIAGQDRYEGTGCSQNGCYKYLQFPIPRENGLYDVRLTVNGEEQEANVDGVEVNVSKPIEGIVHHSNLYWKSSR